MTTLEQAKTRILRQAVRDNIDGTRGLNPRSLRRRRFLLPVWLWGFFIVVSLAYLLVPSYVVSTGTVFREEPTVLVRRSSEADSVRPSPPLENQALTPELPLAAPRPIDRTVFSLPVKKIVLDPGHGGKETGAIAKSGLTEKEITLDISLRLRRLMEEASLEVLLTREIDQTVSLSERAAIANASGADLFVSVHVNWMKERHIRPLETYFLGPTDDPATLRLASVENQESGYSLADFRQLLEKVYIDTRRSESRRLAKAIQNELVQSLKQINPALENRGVKMAPFVVLVATEMPAILVEISCLSNDEEVKLLKRPDYREQIALALFNGIRSYADSLNGYVRKGG